MSYSPSIIFGIKKKFCDLRSGIIKVSANQTKTMAEFMGPGFTNIAEKIISPDGLLKHISNANKLVSQMAHECIF